MGGIKKGRGEEKEEREREEEERGREREREEDLSSPPHTDIRPRTCTASTLLAARHKAACLRARSTRRAWAGGQGKRKEGGGRRK